MTTCQAPIGPNLRSMASLITCVRARMDTIVLTQAMMHLCLHMQQPRRLSGYHQPATLSRCRAGACPRPSPTAGVNTAGQLK